MDYLEFEKQIAKEKIRPIYIFYGKEAFLRSEGMELLRRHLGDNVFFKEYSTQNFSVKALLTDLRSDVLFEDLNLLIIKNADEILSDLSAPLAQYLEAPNNSSILMLELEKLDQRLKFAKVAAQKGLCVDCKPFYDRPKPWLKLPPWESDLCRWVCRRASVYQKKIAPQAAFMLTEFIGNSLKDLDSQLQKIALFLKGQKEITAEDIEKIVYASKRVNVFDFLDCLCAQQLPVALKLLRQIFKNGLQSQDGDSVSDEMHIALQLLRLVHYRIKQLWKVVVSRDTSDIAEFSLKRLQEFAPNFNQSKLIYIWQEVLQTEYLLKQSRIEPAWAMEQLAVKMIQPRLCL